MARAFEKTTLSDAAGRLRPGMRVLLPPGCGARVDDWGSLIVEVGV